MGHEEQSQFSHEELKHILKTWETRMNLDRGMSPAR